MAIQCSKCGKWNTAFVSVYTYQGLSYCPECYTKAFSHNAASPVPDELFGKSFSNLNQSKDKFFATLRQGIHVRGRILLCKSVEELLLKHTVTRFFVLEDRTNRILILKKDFEAGLTSDDFDSTSYSLHLSSKEEFLSFVEGHPMTVIRDAVHFYQDDLSLMPNILYPGREFLFFENGDITEIYYSGVYMQVPGNAFSRWMEKHNNLYICLCNLDTLKSLATFHKSKFFSPRAVSDALESIPADITSNEDFPKANYVHHQSNRTPSGTVYKYISPEHAQNFFQLVRKHYVEKKGLVQTLFSYLK